jgi:MFS family permease
MSLSSRLAHLGFPELAGQGRFVMANAIDSCGSGLMLAFQVVYFVDTTSASLTTVGTALTVAQVLALPTAMVVGPLLDRVGARAVAAMGNGISALGFTGVLFVQTGWQIVLVTLVTQIGGTMYWTSSSALVVLAAKDGARIRWFGFLRALRNVGVGAGGGLGMVAVGVGGVAGLHGVVLANVVTFVIAAYLLVTWKPVRDVGAGGLTAQRSPIAVSQLSYVDVLRDRTYLRLIAVNFSFVYAAMVIGILLAAYIVDGLHQGAWIAGMLVVMNTALVAATQTVVSRTVEHRRPTRVIAVASLLNAVSFGVFALLGILAPGLAILGTFVATVIYTVAEILACSPVNELSVALAPEHGRGRYLAVFQLSWSLGAVSAPLLLTSLLARGAALPWVFLLILSLVALSLAWGLDRSAAWGMASAQRRAEGASS